MEFFNEIDDTSDNDLLNLVNAVNPERKTYTVRSREENLHKWTDKEFLQRFRLSKDTVLGLLVKIREKLQHRSDRNNAVTPLQQLLLTLTFLSTGSFYITTADIHGVQKSTAGKIIQRVVTAIASLQREYICFPITFAEKQKAVQDFAQIARFPRVIGALDCTHIRILSPGGENAEHFRNRKGYFSLNVQAICNANNYIMDLVARWPGSAHDTHIFNNSNIRMKFEADQMENLFLLGDSGYPVSSYLMTSLNQPETEAENLYNEAQIRTRNVIERTFGIWKRRFPILCLGIRCRLPLAQKIIVATAVLHNIACKHRDELPNDEINIDLVQYEPNIERHGRADDAVRQTIINYFQNLL